jgi:hypothetical protein
VAGYITSASFVQRQFPTGIIGGILIGGTKMKNECPAQPEQQKEGANGAV